MIDLGILTWTQQWEFWLISRILRPLEFANVWRWDFLFVPDQVWLGIGAYRLVKHLVSGGAGTLMSRVSSLGQFLRIDPIFFVAFGLVFIAEPHLVRRRARLRRINNGPDQGIILDIGDVDFEDGEANEDQSLDPSLAPELEAAQAGNEVILPASVLRPCRACNRTDTVATNIIIKCGHFPFCNECIHDRRVCTVCEAKNVVHEINPNETFAVGMTSKDLARPPGNIVLNENLVLTRSCAVCQEREGLLTLMPCGHLMFCGPCVLGFRRCPFCSTHIVRAVRGFDVRHNEIVPNPT